MLTCPRLCKEDLKTQLRAFDFVTDDIVMIHASLRAVGPILGGPDELINALEEVIRDGTLMAYIGCQSPFDEIGRKQYSPEDEAFILKSAPAFDKYVARTQRDFGSFAEFFRTHSKDVQISDNVGGRMAALGKRAQWLTADHSLNYGLGKGSPLEKLYQENGMVLLIGSDHDQVTLMHYAEAIAPIENKTVLNLQVPLLRNGVRTWVDIEEFDSSIGVLPWPDERFFATICDAFIEKNNIPSNKIGDAVSYLLPAHELVDFAVELMVETAKEIQHV
ncbi:MAG: AAC(3) family N-acetyltransferase [Candidatus Melainabacteria bacterium]|nr:MAG: AAC(3) family N-acetyltransferase [Candidatus Melainabacteria bacterium]